MKLLFAALAITMFTTAHARSDSQPAATQPIEVIETIEVPSLNIAADCRTRDQTLYEVTLTQAEGAPAPLLTVRITNPAGVVTEEIEALVSKHSRLEADGKIASTNYIAHLGPQSFYTLKLVTSPRQLTLARGGDPFNCDEK